MEAFIIPVLIVAFLAIILLGVYFDRKRTNAIKALAEEWGFEFVGAGNDLLAASTRDFDLFRKGRSRRASNIMRGNHKDAKIEIFDYRYVTGGGKHSRTHLQTVVSISSDRLSLPYFMLVPENFMHKIGNIFGYQDIDFQDYPEFSQRYLLRGDDESQIRQVFNYKVIPWYESRNNVSTEGTGNCLIYYYARRRYAPENWRSLLSEAMEAHHHFI